LKVGIALNKIGKHEDAIKVFKKCVSINPSNEEPFFNIGCSLIKLGNY
jgi:hypothetical protein